MPKTIDIIPVGLDPSENAPNFSNDSTDIKSKINKLVKKTV